MPDNSSTNSTFLLAVPASAQHLWGTGFAPRCLNRTAGALSLDAPNPRFCIGYRLRAASQIHADFGRPRKRDTAFLSFRRLFPRFVCTCYRGGWMYDGQVVGVGAPWFSKRLFKSQAPSGEPSVYVISFCVALLFQAGQ